jgi:hypothetical protein
MTLPNTDLPSLPAGSISPRFALTALDTRGLQATSPTRQRTAQRIAMMTDCSQDVAHSCLRRLRARMLIEPDGYRPTGWLRTRHGDLALKHQP